MPVGAGGEVCTKVATRAGYFPGDVAQDTQQGLTEILKSSPLRKAETMYASMKGSKFSVRMAANDRRVWNDALQAAVLALACNEPDPLCPDAPIDADLRVDCEHRDSARELMIKRVLALKRSPELTEGGDFQPRA